MLAAAGDVLGGLLTRLSTPSAVGPPIAADLTATVEIQKDAPEIIALATELEHDPVKIFEHVRNTIATEPYFGSLKGAVRTLIEGAGNDIDHASLLMALLRASEIPCRYVFGTIEVTATEAARWLGVDSPNELARLLDANGVPYEPVYGAGSITSIRLDHVWIKAYVNYFPYRAAAKGLGDSWIEIDSSFKQNSFTASRDIETQVGFHPQTLLSNVKAQSSIGAAGDSATNLPETYLLDDLLGLASPVRNYLAANDLTVETVFRQRHVAEERFGILPVADQYRIIARGLNFASLPPELRHKITITLSDTAGTTSFSHTASLPELADARITLAYQPESPDDAAIIQTYASESAFPAYLVSLVPVLLINGTAVAQGTPVGMGRSQQLDISFIDLDDNQARVSDSIVAGSVNALVLDYQNMTAAHLDRQRTRLATAKLGLQLDDPTELTAADTLGTLLHAVGISYFHQLDRFHQVTAGSLSVATTRAPSLVRVSWDLTVGEQFGLPVTATADHIAIDVGRDALIPVSIASDDRAAENQFLFTAALTGSALEHNALMQPFFNEAVSTVRVIQAASKSGIHVYTVTSENIDTVTAVLETTLPDDTLSAVRNAVNAGCEVTLPASPVYVEGDEHIAWIKRDTTTGASDFILDNLSGGRQPNTSLTAANLILPGDTAPYQQLLTDLDNWLKVAEDSTTNAGLAYLPAISAINNWYQNRTETDPVTTIAAAIAVSGPITLVTTQPAILNVTTSANLISPNGDGINDAITFSADVTRQAQWELTIQNPTGTTIWNKAGETAAINETFTGPLTTNGVYSYRISAASGDTQAESIDGTFQVDITPPTAQITSLRTATSPTALAETAPLQGQIVIRGTADDPNLQTFTLALQETDTLLFQSDTSVIDGTLHILDTTILPNGTTTLVLTATDAAGNASTVTRPVTIYNPPPDTSAPTLQLTALNPADNSTISPDSPPVSGQIPVSVSASDNQAVAQTELLLDNAQLAANTNADTLSSVINTVTLADGSHILLARASDAAGNTTEQTLAFTTSSPISSFTVTPNLASDTNRTVTISANLAQPHDWTLSFSGPDSIPDVIGSSTAIHAEIDAAQYLDGDYTVTLTVVDIDEPPQETFTIDLIDLPPIADIANLADDEQDDFSLAPARITSGLFELTGTATDPDPADSVSWKLELLKPDGTLIANVTPGTLTDGWNSSRVHPSEAGDTVSGTIAG
jgi:hypothetical protein